MSVNSLLTLSVVVGGWVWQTNPVRSCLIFPRYFVMTRWKSRDITLPTKVCSENYSFSSSHVWMSELDYKEGWVLKNWSFWTVVLENPLASPLDCKEIQPVHPKGDHFWVFIGRTDAESETPILWPPHAKRWLIGKDSDAGRYWGQEEKGTTEDEMVGWHHRLDGHGFGRPM